MRYYENLRKKIFFVDIPKMGGIILTTKGKAIMQIDFQMDGTPNILFEHPAEKVAFEQWLIKALNTSENNLLNLSYNERLFGSDVGYSPNNIEVDQG